MIEKNMKRALCVMSGGMDSTLSAYMMKNNDYEVMELRMKQILQSTCH